jgi:hypothetical protein
MTLIGAALARIKLRHLPDQPLDDTRTPGVGLLCEPNATNESGQPASGTIQPTNVSWSQMR